MHPLFPQANELTEAMIKGCVLFAPAISGPPERIVPTISRNGFQ